MGDGVRRRAVDADDVRVRYSVARGKARYFKGSECYANCRGANYIIVTG